MMATYRLSLLPLFLCMLTLPAQATGDTAHPKTVLNLCTHCHSAQGNAALPGWPPLPSMSKSELITKLKGHRSMQIEDSTMAKVAEGLTDQQIEWIADYFSRQEDTSEQPLSTLKK